MGDDASWEAVVDVCRGSLVRGEEKDESYSVTLPPLLKQFGEGPFLFQHDTCPSAQSKVHTEMVCQDWCGRT